MSSSSSKRVNFFLGRVLIKSSFKPRQVASLLAERLVPGGDGLEWEDWDGEETSLLSLPGVLGGDLDLEGDEIVGYVLSYQTDLEFINEQELKLGIEIDQDEFLDVTPLLLYALGQIPGLEIKGVEFRQRK